MRQRILVTGATGYIGSKIIPDLLREGHSVVALARSAEKVPNHLYLNKNFFCVEADLLDRKSLEKIPNDVTCVFYLVHAMAKSHKIFDQIEHTQIANFLERMADIHPKQIIYLGGLLGREAPSKHMASRLHVEKAIIKSGIPYTIFRAGIIIGAGSASFEIIRDLVEKIPVMIAPRWIGSYCQPIALVDINRLLVEVIEKQECINEVFDVGGNECLTYRDMLYGYAKQRGLRRLIITLPMLTPRLSSYWLVFVSSTNFLLAMSLIDSLKQDAICRDRRIFKVFQRKTLSYEQSVQKAFERETLLPKWGCLQDVTRVSFKEHRYEIIEKLWAIGGNNGWYAMDWAWQFRGLIDRLIGGVGMRRGREHPEKLQVGDHLDFWRVVVADRESGRLTLKAEMKVPGEAWVEFIVGDGEFYQRALFRPKGVFGRFYWWGLYPVHRVIFMLMPKRICKI